MDCGHCRCGGDKWRKLGERERESSQSIGLSLSDTYTRQLFHSKYIRLATANRTHAASTVAGWCSVKDNFRRELTECQCCPAFLCWVLPSRRRVAGTSFSNYLYHSYFISMFQRLRTGYFLYLCWQVWMTFERGALFGITVHRTLRNIQYFWNLFLWGASKDR
jgi:hypothetical protein